MSQIEQNFRLFLSKNPEIESTYSKGLINRRSLARYLIKQNVANSNQLDALIAMLRRYNFKSKPPRYDLFSKIKIMTKDKILILDFQKEKSLVKQLSQIIEKTNYDRGDTLKIVVGSASVKLFIDETNEKELSELKKFSLKRKELEISEISILFPKEATIEEGIISAITKEFLLNDITISEILTASPELLIYLKDEYVLKAYELLNRLKTF